MAIVIVVKKFNDGWNVGDHVEVFGDQLENLVKNKQVRVLLNDEIEIKKPRRGRPPKKGVEYVSKNSEIT